MPVTTAKAWYGNAPSGTSLGILTGLHTALTSGSPSSHYHTVLDYDFTDPYGNFNSPWMLIRNPTAGYRIFLFAGTVSIWQGIFAMLDITDTIEAPSVATGTPSAYASNYPSTSGFVNIYETYYTGSYTGTLINVAEYSDAILLGAKAIGRVGWSFAMHAGKIYIPFNASDPALGVNGYGILGGTATVKDSAGGVVNQWLGRWNSETYPTHSKIKIGISQWRAATIVSGTGDSDDSTAPATDDLNGNVRMIPVVLQVMASNSSTTASSMVGYTKYIRLYKGLGGHGSIIDSADATEDQAWFRFSGENDNSRSVFLWSKTPTNGDI